MKTVYILAGLLFCCSLVKAELNMQAKIILRNDSAPTRMASVPNYPPNAPIFYRDGKKAKPAELYTVIRLFTILNPPKSWISMCYGLI